MKIDREQLAWAAGFWDGEGCIGHYEYNRKIIAAVPQADPRPIARFLYIVGFGNVHTVEPSGRAKKRRWIWQAQSFEHVQALTALLWPFLSGVKKEQAKSALLGYLKGRRPN